MPKVIYKYPLSDISSTMEVVALPVGMKPLKVDMQHGVMTLWAEQDHDATKQERVIRVLGTGFEVPDGLTYLGTVSEGAYVWHVYLGGAA